MSEPPDAVFASYLIRMQLTARELSPGLLNLFFQTQSYWNTIRAGVSGRAQGGFNATKLGERVIPFPGSPKEQHEVVAHDAALAAETQRLTRLYEQKQAALAALKKSLLHQAFTGEL